jgi:circadian clock protein KaiC
MAHSNQVREFVLSDRGVELRPVYLGPEGVVTGSARLAQEARERAAAVARQQELERKTRALTRRRRQLERQIEDLRADLEQEERELHLQMEERRSQEEQLQADRLSMERSRQAVAPTGEGQGDGR